MDYGGRRGKKRKKEKKKKVETKKWKHDKWYGRYIDMRKIIKLNDP